MDDLADIPRLTRTFVDLANESAAFDEHDWMAFDAFASSYRVQCDSSAKIVLDDLEGYPDIQPLVAIENAQKELDIGPRHRREALTYYSNWAYRYGAKQAADPTLPDVDYEGNEPYTTIQLQAKDFAESGAATVNDMVLVFRLTHEYFSETREDWDPDLPLLEFYERVYEEVAALVDLKSADEDSSDAVDAAADAIQPDELDRPAQDSGINWNLMGGLLANGSNMADRDTMQEMGRRQGRRAVIEELEETDLSLEEWLAQQE